MKKRMRFSKLLSIASFLICKPSTQNRILIQEKIQSCICLVNYKFSCKQEKLMQRYLQVLRHEPVLDSYCVHYYAVWCLGSDKHHRKCFGALTKGEVYIIQEYGDQERTMAHYRKILSSALNIQKHSPEQDTDRLVIRWPRQKEHSLVMLRKCALNDINEGVGQ